MKILLLLMIMVASEIQAGSMSVVQTAAPISRSQNVANCKKFSWWWYVTPDITADIKQNALLKADAMRSGCDIGRFCGSCGPFSCLIKSKYYACRNLCENGPVKLSSGCLIDGKVYSLFYHIQLIKGMVPMPTEKIDPNKKLIWARVFYPQMDKVTNLGWDAKNDKELLLGGVPLPSDSPQVAFSGGVFGKLNIDKMEPGMVLTTTTNGTGYIHLTTSADLLNSPMGQAIYQQAQVQQSALSTVPHGVYVNPSYSSPAGIPVAVPVK